MLNLRHYRSNPLFHQLPEPGHICEEGDLDQVY